MHKSNPLRLMAWLIALAMAMATACTSQTITDASSIPAQRIDRNVPEEQLIDIGISMFTPGLAKNEKYNEQKLIDPQVRQAESAYLAYNLRNTLEETENWGAVRIIPRATRAIDLMVYGEIVESTGIELRLRIRAVDATGREWLDKKYVDRASQLSYRDEIGGDEDAFQDLYNQIADDLLAAYIEMTSEYISRIRTTAMLRFAEDISPYAFEDFLSENRRGKTTIERLPSENDPMLLRIEKIREREQMFIDLLDEHYSNFYARMNQPYTDWRRYTYDEIRALEDLRRGALAAKLIGAATVVGGIAVQNSAESSEQLIAGKLAVLGGIAVVRSGFELSSQSKLHVAAIQELAESFRTELEPMVVEVEGETVKLEGTAEEQFDDWRRLLREIYQSETGLNLGEGESEPVLPDVYFDQ